LMCNTFELVVGLTVATQSLSHSPHTSPFAAACRAQWSRSCANSTPPPYLSLFCNTLFLHTRDADALLHSRAHCRNLCVCVGVCVCVCVCVLWLFGFGFCWVSCINTSQPAYGCTRTADIRLTSRCSTPLKLSNSLSYGSGPGGLDTASLQELTGEKAIPPRLSILAQATSLCTLLPRLCDTSPGKRACTAC
jgi:hypothetical protein